MIRISDALHSLRPNSQFAVRGDVIEWHDTEQTQPSKSEIDAEVTRLQADYDAKEYQRKRKAEYPSIEECVHAILDDDLDNLQALRQAVKDKYPK
jgi:hypothetical protein|tara:strand:+ start:486 stop:770 length:285 start_codon:yes stop_codon:yes gene_type:complete